MQAFGTELSVTELSLVSQVGQTPHSTVYAGVYRGAAAMIQHVDAARTTERLRQRWLRQARRLARLAPHANVVTYYGVAADPLSAPGQSSHDTAGSFYIVSALCDGGTLRDHLVRTPQVTEADRVTWLVDIAVAMAYLHAQSPPILHGDLCAKTVRLQHTPAAMAAAAAAGAGHASAPIPLGMLRQRSSSMMQGMSSVSALMRTSDLDGAAGSHNASSSFGSAAALVAKVSDPGLTDGIAGVRWAAPEVLRGEPATPANDVWAFAVTAWEMYMGGAHQPYRDRSDDSAVVAFVRDQRGVLPRPPRCPEAIWAILERCFLYGPHDRPSFAALASTLASVAAADGVLR